MIVCLFDIDGTLLSSGGAGKAAMETALLEEFGLSEPIAQVPYSGRTDRAIGGDLFRHHGIANTTENWRRFVAGYLHRLPDSLGRHQGQIMPGIAELLQLLATRARVAVGLLTGNIRDGARLKLSHYGLYEHFAFGGFGDEHLDRDDVAREALAGARTRFDGQIDPGNVWVIGDTPLDVRCARAIGAKVAAIATGWHDIEELAAACPDLVLADLSDPAPLLAKWD